MRRVWILVIYLLGLMIPLLAAPTVQAQTATATPYPFPAGFGPPDGFEILSPEDGEISTTYDNAHPCDQSLLLLNTGYYDSPNPVLPIRITQTVPSGKLRIMAMVKPHYYFEQDYYAAMQVTTYEDDYTTQVGSVREFVYPFLGYLNYWMLYEIEVPAYEGYGGYIEIQLTNRQEALGESGMYIAGLFITDSWQSRPGSICEETMPTITPTPTHTHTPIPTPTGTITQTWTPSPTPTNLATAPVVVTGTPTPTPLAIATWTAAPTSSPFPSLTPIPVTAQYSTPVGGWATVSYPTMEPVSTMAPPVRFTPNATYESRLGDWTTAIAQAQLVYSDIITAHNWAINLTIDASAYYTTVTSTGTITNPTFFVSRITLPLAYAKGIVRYMPNLGPLILFMFGAFLFMISIRLSKLAYTVVMWGIEKVERIWQALPFT